MFKWFGAGQKTADAAPTQEPSAKSLDHVSEPTGFLSGFSRLKSALSETGKTLFGLTAPSFSQGKLDEDEIDRLEENLIRADVGLSTAIALTDRVRENKGKIQTPEALNHFLRQEFTTMLSPYEAAATLRYEPGKLNIYLVVGVNGAGKTTFIGKLAHQFIRQGKRVLIGAGDTFRAAAEEQLEVWAQRAGADLVRQDGVDPAAVIYDTLAKAKAEHYDVVLLDTAGRLQNKFNLMEELKKVYRVIEKEQGDNSILESLLVLDATTGQNALKQAEIFKEAVSLTGVVLTKLDGSAKGGVVLAIAQEYQLPVKMVGIGEGIEDLKPFHPAEFVDALFDRS